MMRECMDTCVIFCSRIKIEAKINTKKRRKGKNKILNLSS